MRFERMARHSVRADLLNPRRRAEDCPPYHIDSTRDYLSWAVSHAIRVKVSPPEAEE